MNLRDLDNAIIRLLASEKAELDTKIVLVVQTPNGIAHVCKDFSVEQDPGWGPVILLEGMEE